MLIVKAFANQTEISPSISILRVEDFVDSQTYHKYRIVKPEGFENVILKHKYEDSWLVLLDKVLRIIL